MTIRNPHAISRLAKTRHEAPQRDLALGDVEGTSLSPVPLGERLAECVAACDCSPAEAARARLLWLKERA